ncbi:hypothetical protein CCGE525_36620 (plasmid) [Rhizobium jaguaris]|uniref:Uncharacterized protein n=1 Tax=Rhizobium jaguaris TaxID=1312183 RepID=A0A387G118_9HYPH|nr:hypothetical protein CCGE525_36620 [Rhizobium jaguaris]
MVASPAATRRRIVFASVAVQMVRVERDERFADLIPAAMDAVPFHSLRTACCLPRQEDDARAITRSFQ